MTLNYRRPAKKLAEIRKTIRNLKGTGSVIIVDKFTNDICAIYNKMPDVDWNRYCVYECIKE